MASFGHIAVGMAAARVYDQRRSRKALASAMVCWSALSLLPDVDVLGFRFGVAYAAPFGHRGASHSFAFALFVGLLCGVCAPWFDRPRLRTLPCVSAVVASHPLLDTLTDGGLGCALFWPFDSTRYFAPIQPLPVAPIGRGLVSGAGLYVALFEVLAFLPVWLYAVWPRRR